MFSPIRVKPKIIPQMFVQFRFARFKPNPPNGNSPKGSRLFELFKNRFRGAIVSEVNVHIPKHLKVPRLSMGLIEVDASWLPNKLVKVGLICRSNIDGKVLVAKSCVIDIHKLLPSYFSGIDNIEDDMLPPELCAASYSLITGVEFNLTCFDLVTDSQIVKKFLTDNPGNYFKRPTHGFLAICIKSMWFYTIGSGCGRVFWLRSKDNRVADVLSRCRHEHLRMGCGKYLKFVNYVKMDLHCFQLTFISKLGTGVFVTKGLGYNFLADRMLTLMEEALVDVNRNDQLCHGFRYYDSDNDGFVTLEELETAIWEFGVNDENFIRELMAELDDNLDGRITFRRLMAVVGLCTDSAMELDLHNLVTIIIMSYQLVILTSFEGGDGGNRPHDRVPLKDADIVAAHPLTRAKYLATPPLVAAYALAGTVDIEFENEPIGTGKDGKSVYFREIWPSNEEIAQLLQVDEQKKAQVKLYAFGSRVALTDDDSDVVERSRKLFKDAAPTFMDDFDLWIFSEFSRSLVCKAYKGSIDAAALEFSSYDPLESIDKFPMDPSTGIRCAEVFLFFAVDGDVPGDVSNREAMVEFLNSLNSKNGIRKIHAFSVTAGSVVATREKLDELRGIHQSA